MSEKRPLNKHPLKQQRHTPNIEAMSVLEINDLHARVGADKDILNGLSLTLPKGEVHAIMGPNGSGKKHLGESIGWSRGFRSDSRKSHDGWSIDPRDGT